MPIAPALRSASAISGGFFGVNLYYMALQFDDIDAVRGADGVINGTYETFVQLAGGTLSFKF